MNDKQLQDEYRRLLINVNKAIADVKSDGSEINWDFKDAAEEALKAFERKHADKLFDLMLKDLAEKSK